MMKRFLYLVGTGLLFLFISCQSKKKEAEADEKYVVTSPLVMDTSFTKEYVSQIQSTRNIEIRAQEKGFLEHVYVDEGQYVHAGQLLFSIMPRIYEAEYMKTKALVTEAELELQNTKTLADKNIVSKTEEALKRAKLDEAKADMALAQAHLSFTQIRAPYDGILDRIPKKLGSLVDEGELLTTLSDNKNIYAYFNVSEQEYLNYKNSKDTGSAGELSLVLASGTLHKYKGKIEVIEGQFDNETGNIAFRASFPNPDMLLKHGETGKVQMRVPVHNAIIIPQKATYELQDKTYAYVVDKNNVVRSRNITIQYRLPAIFVVKEGLAAGDKILLEGLQRVKEDERIKYEYADPANVLPALQLIKQ